MEKEVYCIFHSSDFDGKCSAKIVEKYYLSKGLKVNFIPIDYGDPFNITEKIPKEEQIVVIVDFALSPDIMKELYYSHDFIWIDHHDYSIKDSIDTSYQYCDGYRSTEAAACQLTWLYFYFGKSSEELREISPKKIIDNIPLAINLLGWYDTNDIKKHKNIIAFQFGMNVINNSFKNPIWDALFTTNTKTITTIIGKGRIIYSYMSRTINDLALKMTYELTVDGLKAIVINSPPYFPRTLVMKEIFDDTKYDFCIMYHKISKGWKVSFITTKNDLNMSQLAAKYKGGGHKGIASFKTSDISMFLNTFKRPNNKRDFNKPNNNRFNKSNNNNNNKNGFNKSNNRDYNKKQFNENNQSNVTTIREIRKSTDPYKPISRNENNQPQFSRYSNNK